MTQIDPATAEDGDVLFEHREGVRYPVRIYKDSTSKPLPVSIHGHVHDIANAMVALLDRLREAEEDRDRFRKAYCQLNQTTSDILASAIGDSRGVYPFLRDCPEIGGTPEDGDKRLNTDTDCAETAAVAAKVISELREELAQVKAEVDALTAPLDDEQAEWLYQDILSSIKRAWLCGTIYPEHTEWEPTSAKQCQQIANFLLASNRQSELDKRGEGGA